MINIVYRPTIVSDENFQYQTRYSSGADLISQENLTLNPWETGKVATGVFITDFSLEDLLAHNLIPEVQIRPRSGNSLLGLLIHNSTIDVDSRKEIYVIITNVSNKTIHIEKGDRVAQLICGVVYRPPQIAVSQRKREGGFGSTSN